MKWIRRVKGNRLTPKMNEVNLSDKEDSLALREELISLMTDAVAFIGRLTGTTDETWVRRFSSIIVAV